VADCMPVLFTDLAGSRVAAAHAGWRGLAGGVIENTLAALTADGLAVSKLLAYLGPAIGPAAFEVGPDVYEAFVSRHPEDAAAFTAHRPGKWRADLFALARAVLGRAGVTCVFADELCTLSDAERFYSYRRERITGRMAALIWRD
jgi:polyphenol oxidase